MATRILLIEDNQDQIDLLTPLLQRAGYELLIARNGREGLTVARKERPDLILTDLMLPQLNGYEICTMLKQDTQYQDIPIMVLSATKIEEQDAKLAVECGANAYFLKTDGPQQLLQAIERVLSGQGS